MRRVLPFTIILNIFLVNILPAQTGGEEIFKSVCASCHTIGKGKLVGPDLSKVYERRDQDWLVKFIRSSQTVIKSGDQQAVAVFNEFNKIQMPDNNYSDDQIISIIDFIKKSDGGGSAGQAADTSGKAANEQAGGAAKDTTAAPIDYKSAELGRSLFNGFAPFLNGATPCLNCHNIKDQSFMGGGKLAIDLTKAYTKLGPQGIRGILISPPFPAMKAAIPDSLTNEEITSIISLLRVVDDRNPDFKRQTSGGVFFLTLAFVCAIFLMVHIYLFYDNRKIPDNPPEHTYYKNSIAEPE
jgi:mono/diheme cytochrome c family protein